MCLNLTAFSASSRASSPCVCSPSRHTGTGPRLLLLGNCLQTGCWSVGGPIGTLLVAGRGSSRVSSDGGERGGLDRREHIPLLVSEFRETSQLVSFSVLTVTHGGYSIGIMDDGETLTWQHLMTTHPYLSAGAWELSKGRMYCTHPVDEDIGAFPTRYLCLFLPYRSYPSRAFFCVGHGVLFSRSRIQPLRTIETLPHRQGILSSSVVIS